MGQRLRDIESYRPPADGAADSADPLFVPKDRKCGRCGVEFTTSAGARYFCPACRSFANHAAPDVREVRLGGGKKYGWELEGTVG